MATRKVQVTRTLLPSPKGAYMDLSGPLGNYVFDPRQEVTQQQLTFQAWQVNDIVPDVTVAQQQRMGDPRPAVQYNSAYPTVKPQRVTQWVPQFDLNQNQPRNKRQGYERDTHPVNSLNLQIGDEEEAGSQQINTPADLAAALIGTLFSN